MKKIVLLIVLIANLYATTNKNLQDGDIIFHTSLSPQSKAIQLATNSIYSHCGIIYKIKDKFYVFEAIQPVKLTPLEEWIERGKDKKFVVKRLKSADTILTKEALQKMKQLGKNFLGKDYDFTFEWSDEKIYCSELVWKIYKRAFGIEIGKLEKLKNFDLSHKIVQEKLNERYKDNIPYDEIVISPKTIFESEKLKTVMQK